MDLKGNTALQELAAVKSECDEIYRNFSNTLSVQKSIVKSLEQSNTALEEKARTLAEEGRQSDIERVRNEQTINKLQMDNNNLRVDYDQSVLS